MKHGFHHAGRVHRVEGDAEKRVVEFVVFGPKALACIKLSTLDGPTLSRCINIRMQRKRSIQKVARLRHYDGREFQSKCLRWAVDHQDQIGASIATMPDALGDREQDIWEPLFILANMAGGEWPAKVCNAALTLCGESGDGATDTAVLLLGWIQTYFHETGAEKVSSASLVHWLNERPDAAFSGWSDGRGITQNDVRRLLAGFEIRPSTVRIGDKTAKGFAHAWFEDAFASYLTGNPSQTGNTVTLPANIDDSRVLAAVTDGQCYQTKNGETPNETSECYRVTAGNPETPAKAKPLQHELVEEDA